MTDISQPVRAHLMSQVPRWLEWRSQLPEVLRRCTDQWGLEVEGVLVDRVGSSLHRVRLRGRDAVLKLAAPGPDLVQQADVLAAARGAGYVHLYDRDDELGALVLEPLGAPLSLRVSAFGPELLTPVVAALREAWSVPSSVAPEPTESTHRAAQAWSQISHLAHDCPVGEQHAAAIQRALLYAGQRLESGASSPLVLCHGDPHIGNLLAVPSPRPGAPEGYVYVDPDGFRCEPEYDLGVVLRGFNRAVLAASDPVVEVRGWCATMASATECDAEAIWQWAFIERVASGLRLVEQGWPERGLPFLDAASWLIARKSG